MKHLRKNSLGTIAPFLIPTTARAEALLFLCLHGVEAVSDYLRNDVATRGGARGNTFSIRIQKLLEKKFENIIEHFVKANEEISYLWKEVLNKKQLMGAQFHPEGLNATSNQQVPLTYIDLLEHKLLATEVSTTYGTDWMPLVKATTKQAAIIHSSTLDNESCDEKQVGCSNHFNLAGKCVLCVGGKARLYHEYRRLVETSEGNLIIYRGDQKDDIAHLHQSLIRADMVVCPVDCVNHEVYFTVKRYCKHTGKPCVLLDRSNLPTFRVGVEMLVGTPAHSTVSSLI